VYALFDQSFLVVCLLYVTLVRPRRARRSNESWKGLLTPYGHKLEKKKGERERERENILPYVYLEADVLENPSDDPTDVLSIEASA